MSSIRQNFREISQQISHFCQLYGRETGSLRLVAVGKVHPVEKILELAELGQRDFGENYLQEALEKIAHCRSQLAGVENLEWHFIGHIQSRKCRDIAENFSWVHTVESIKVAQKLNKYRQGKALNICIQVNIDNEETKSGVNIAQIDELAEQIASLPNLNLRGLMILPKSRTEKKEQREVFYRCRKMLERLNASGHNLDQLSMGMTNDMEAAIAEGATMIRIGTALFGSRPAR